MKGRGERRLANPELAERAHSERSMRAVEIHQLLPQREEN